MDDCISRQAAIEAVVAWTVEDRPDIEMPTDLVGRIESLPSAQPEQQWIPCSEPPETNENVFIARGNENFMSCCIGHYDLDAETWFEDRNWFAKILYDALYWCEMPTLPDTWRGEEHECMDV